MVTGPLSMLAHCFTAVTLPGCCFPRLSAKLIKVAVPAFRDS